MESGTQNAPKFVPKVVSPNVTHPLGTIFELFWGPPNRPKIDLWIHKMARSRFFIDFYGVLVLAQFFEPIWDRFFMKNRCFFQCDFPKFLLFFSTWRPSRNTVIYVSKPTFSFFVFLFFFRRKIAKKHEKIGH